MSVTRTSGPNTPPLLISGCYRSGTTFVAEILSTSPEVGLIFEPLNPTAGLGLGGARVPRWCTYIQDTSHPLMEPFENLLKFDLTIARDYLRQPEQIQAARAVQLRFDLYKKQHRRPVVKDPFSLFSVPQLSLRFGMRTILMLRHPAAFVWSNRRLGWNRPLEDLLNEPGLIESALWMFESELRNFQNSSRSPLDHSILLWRIIATTIERILRDHPEATLLRHEDLSRRPQEEFEKLFREGGLTFGPREREKIREFTDASNPVDAPEGVIHCLRRNSELNVHAWKRHLNLEDIRKIRRGTETIAPMFYSDADW